MSDRRQFRPFFGWAINRQAAQDTSRSGKVLVLLAILLPSVVGVAGLIVDGGLMMSQARNLQHAADAASTAAAMNLAIGKSVTTARSTANEVVHLGNEMAEASLTVNIPPVSGAYAGRQGYVEVIVEHLYKIRLMHVLDDVLNRTIQARSVAGFDDATDGAAIVVLDPDPADLSLQGLEGYLAGVNLNELSTALTQQTGVAPILSAVPAIGSVANGAFNASLGNLLPELSSGLIEDAIGGVALTPLPTLTAGLEIEGVGRLIVDGAIHVNTEWGGVDENGEPAGETAGPPYAASCMPVLATTRVNARDIRVVGGVDNQNSYQPFDSEGENPLQANRLPVPDPFAELPIPSTASDGSVNSNAASPSHSVRVAIPAADVETLLNNVLAALPPLLRPLFTPLTATLTTTLTQPTLQPGVYDSITVLSPTGGARFEPGIYVIRGTSPITNMSLCILGPVEAEGVMFYITSSAAFDASTGAPDADEGTNAAPSNIVPSLPPSTVIISLLSSARISGLDDPSSPFHEMLIFQRRIDRRPIVIEAQQLLGGGHISGTIYAKWAHVTFLAGAGSYDLRFVAGTMRVLTLLETTIAPTTLLPPAKDVFLLE